MIASSLAGIARAAVCAIALVALVVPVQAQQSRRVPSANAIIMAREIITVKGSANMFDPIVPNIIERVKAMLLQTNPALSKDMNDVAAKLRTELAPRATEMLNEMAKSYAASFTDQELKEALAFYKSPLGRKLTVEEPRILDQSVDAVRAWSDRFGEEVIAKMRAEMKKKGHDL